MKPIKFPEANIIYGKDQDYYRDLPALNFDNFCVSCWRFTLLERIKILFGFPLWIMQLHFGHPLQPQKPSIEKPFIKEES